MPNKVAELAAAIRGTMPPEPSLVPPLVDVPLRLYADSMAAALLGPLPAPATPPGVPGALTASYPAPWAPSVGPHLVACSHGALPSPSDATLGQLHVSQDGSFHLFNGTAWKTLTVT